MTQQNNDVQAALDVVNKFLRAKEKAEIFLPVQTSDTLSEWLSCFTHHVNYRLSYSDWERLELVKRALAQQQPDAGFSEVFAEIEKAVRKFPTWPTDPLHALAVLGEEFGELTKSTLQLTYEPHKTNIEEFRTEAIQTAAMALRFYKSLDVYEFKQCEQHQQKRAEQKGGK